MEIKVVGPGCKKCTALYKLVKDVVGEMDNEIDVVHVDDISQMLTLGVSQSPGLIINDKIVSQGKVLKQKEVTKLITANL